MTVRKVYTRGGGMREPIVASVYLTYDSEKPPPSHGLRNVVGYCSAIHSGKQILMELQRFHFPGSAEEDVTLHGQGKPNLRALAAQKEDWKLS
jgi:hypothetical protein